MRFWKQLLGLVCQTLFLKKLGTLFSKVFLRLTDSVGARHVSGERGAGVCTGRSRITHLDEKSEPAGQGGRRPDAVGDDDASACNKRVSDMQKERRCAFVVGLGCEGEPGPAGRAL